MKNKTVKAKHVYELALTVTVTAAGVNAARWITLVLDVANFAYFAFRIVASGHLDGAAMIYAVYMILESIALYLVFISQGKRWFRRSTVAASA